MEHYIRDKKRNLDTVPFLLNTTLTQHIVFNHISIYTDNKDTQVWDLTYDGLFITKSIYTLLKRIDSAQTTPKFRWI